MPVLFIMRHAESDMNPPEQRDFDRILNANGRVQAKQAAQWIAEVGPLPDSIVSSPASRTLETAQLVAATLGLPDSIVTTDDTIYEAHYQTLAQVIAKHAIDHQATLLVGHNPGVSSLLEALLGGWTDEQRHLGFPPATVCKVELESDWAETPNTAVTLVDAFRPG